MVTWIACNRLYETLLKYKHPRWSLLPYGNVPEEVGSCSILALNTGLPRGGQEGEIDWEGRAHMGVLWTDLPFKRNEEQWLRWKRNMERCGCKATRHLKEYRPRGEWVEVQHLHASCLTENVRCAVKYLLEDS